jgi:hypothetical protein
MDAVLSVLRYLWEAEHLTLILGLFSLAILEMIILNIPKLEERQAGRFQRNAP